jgi:hypothetical protein
MSSGCFPVNQGRHDLTRTRLRAMFEDRNVAITNMAADHRVAGDPERKRISRRLETYGLNGDWDPLSFLSTI